MFLVKLVLVFYVLLLIKVTRPVLPYFTTPSFMNAVNFLTGEANLTINNIFGLLNSGAIQYIPDMQVISSHIPVNLSLS